MTFACHRNPASSPSAGSNGVWLKALDCRGAGDCEIVPARPASANSSERFLALIVREKNRHGGGKPANRSPDSIVIEENREENRAPLLHGTVGAWVVSGMEWLFNTHGGVLLLLR